VISLFRISRKAYLPQDPSGGYHSEGRWHPQGIPVLYFCTSLPMCIFELRANKVEFDFIRTGYHFTRCDVESGSVEIVPEEFYVEDWTINKKASQEYGKSWLKSNRTLLLAVRSAPLPTETNYIVNPSHPSFSGLVFSPPASIPLDLRIS
jgi:RES domain-containing protein